MDFRSLYPSIMRTYNISTDTLLTSARDIATTTSPTGSSFVAKDVREGILPHVLTALLEAREHAKALMKAASGEQRRMLNARQLALKDMSNSIYGYTGYVRARLYHTDVANSITAYGRENIERTKQLVESQFPVEVVYGDTDSIFVKTVLADPGEAQKLGAAIAQTISDALPGYLELQFEKTYRTFLILTKKRYAGWKFVYDNGWKDEIEMKGIETVRRDWCPLVSETMKQVLDTVLMEGDVQKAIGGVKRIIEDIKAGSVPLEKLTIVKGITRNIDSYEGMAPHIELAKKLNARNPHDPVKIGDRLGYVVIRGNQMLSKRTEDPEYVRQRNLQIDPEYYIYSQVLPPIERILTALGVSRSEVLGGGRQTNIFDSMTGTTRRTSIAVKPLTGWEELVCRSCHKSHRRMPLRGLCDCGGDLLIGYQGSMGTKLSVS